MIKKSFNRKRFFEALNKDSSVFSDAVITEEITFSVWEVLKKIQFNKCTFRGDLNFSGIPITEGIEFVDCTFEGNVIISGCIFRESYKSGYGFYNLIFNDVKIEKSLVFLSNILSSSILIKKSIIHKLDFSSNHTHGSLKIIESCNIIDFKLIDRSSFKNGVTINDSEVSGGLRINNSEISSFSVLSSKINDDFWFWNNKINSVSLNKSEILDCFTFEANKISKGIYFHENEIDSVLIKISVKNGDDIIRNKINEIYLENTNFKKSFSLEDNLNDGQHSVDKITINFSEQLKGALYFKDVRLDKFVLKGSNFTSDLYFYDLSVRELLFNDLINKRSISFHHLQPLDKNSLVRFDRCILSEMAFFDSNLKGFEKFEYKSTDLSQIISNSSSWPTFYSLLKNEFENNNISQHTIRWYYFKKISAPEKTLIMERLLVMKNLFKQLKLSFDKHGDSINYFKYKSYEMKAYRYYLKFNKRFYHTERINLMLNHSNDHGNKWFWPIGWALIFTLLFYCLIISSFSNKLNFSLAANLYDLRISWSVFVENINLLPRLLNPTYRISWLLEEKDGTFNFGVYLFSFLQKVSISFFIYQLITAFRKYGRK